jgi:hypothetical protein
MREALRQGLFLGALAANVALVALTVVAYFFEWDETAYWTIFVVWAGVILLLVLVGFASRTPDLSPPGGTR